MLQIIIPTEGDTFLATFCNSALKPITVKPRQCQSVRDNTYERLLKTHDVEMTRLLFMEHDQRSKDSHCFARPKDIIAQRRCEMEAHTYV